MGIKGHDSSFAQLQRVAGLLLVVAVWVVYFVWWTPRRLERALRSQGLDGTPYRFPHGDREQSARLDREVNAKPMPFSHSIIPRVAPCTHRTVSQYGKISFTWAGSVPEVTITDVGLVRQLPLNMSHDSEKPKLNPLAKFFFKGDFTYESEKWVKHRRILNPAFHMEKLKQMLPAFRTYCNDLMGRWENTVGSETRYELDVWLEMSSQEQLSEQAMKKEDGSTSFKLSRLFSSFSPPDIYVSPVTSFFPPQGTREQKHWKRRSGKC
ncbi:cytochrome P450 CYP72A616-like [Musa acuminata AAA Group]|uniref:cytochrome P450 CYP72A616-like n=1 Tax=Musa acuminata AAA Group TaxID=214697 RepID=UPI0031DBFD89